MTQNILGFTAYNLLKMTASYKYLKETLKIQKTALKSTSLTLNPNCPSLSTKHQFLTSSPETSAALLYSKPIHIQQRWYSKSQDRGGKQKGKQ